MKKIKVLVLSLFMVLLLTGCGGKKLTCEIENPGTNMNAESVVDYYFNDNDKVDKATFVANFKDIEVDNLESVWDDLVSQFTSQNEPVDEDGFKRTVSRDDKNYIFTVKINVDYTKITDEVLSKYGIQDISDKTYDEVKEISENSGYKCK